MDDDSDELTCEEAALNLFMDVKRNQEEKMKALLAEARDALQAFGVFITPLALRRKPTGQWDEYEMDAIKRRQAFLDKYPW